MARTASDAQHFLDEAVKEARLAKFCASCGNVADAIAHSTRAIRLLAAAGYEPEVPADAAPPVLQ